MSRLTYEEPATAMSPPARAEVASSGPFGLVMRALIAVGLIAGWVQLAQTPMNRGIEDLLWALEEGEVSSITIERPPPDSRGQLSVEWDGPGRPSYSSYTYDTTEGATRDDLAGDELDDPEYLATTDQRTQLFDLAEHSGVEVIERDFELYPGGTRWELAGIASIAGIFLLISGPQPRLATKWAWFWLALLVPIAWLAFVVLEPTPWGRRGPLSPATRRLTAGWAFLLGIVLAGVLATIPWYRDLFPM